MLIIYYSSKSDAMDVVNFNEYQGLVTKIYKKRPTKPVVVFVEMPAVEKAFSSKVSTAILCPCQFSDYFHSRRGLEVVYFCLPMTRKVAGLGDKATTVTQMT